MNTKTAVLLARVAQLEAAISWVLGESGSDFAEVRMGRVSPHWWRPVLRDKAGLTYDPVAGRSVGPIPTTRPSARPRGNTEEPPGAARR